VLKKDKEVIGRREIIDLPLLNLFKIDAKIDTGAYTSAIHCHDIKVVKSDEGAMVHFKILDPSHADYNHKEFILPVFDERRIKNSFGQVQKRVIIKTTMCMFGKEFPVELSLADRSRLEYPILIGRKVLKNRFIVDVSKVNISLKQSNSQ
jgi:hypothetical protein